MMKILDFLLLGGIPIDIIPVSYTPLDVYKRQAAVRQIETITLARELWQLFPSGEQSSFFSLLLKKCYAHCIPLLPADKLQIVLILSLIHIFIIPW